MDRGTCARGLQRAARARREPDPGGGRVRGRGSGGVGRTGPRAPGAARSTVVPSPTSRSSRPSAPPTAPRCSSDPSPRRRTPPGSPSSRVARRARAALLTGIDHVNLAVPVAVLRRGGVVLQQPARSRRRREPGGPVAQRAGAEPGRPLDLGHVPARPQRRPAGLGHLRPAAARGLLDRRRHHGRSPRPRPRARPARHPAELLRRPVGALRAHRPARWRPWPRSGSSTTATPSGDFTHFYTETIGGVFFEVVQRRGSYEGYGAPDAGVRLAAQHRHDLRATDMRGY